jgi:alpha-L-fucosidase
VPPDRRGYFTSADSVALIQFRKLREQNLQQNVLKISKVFIQKNEVITLTDGKEDTYQVIPIGTPLTISLNTPQKVNCIQLSEAIALGQRIKKFSVELLNQNNEPVYQMSYTTIGHKRIITFPETSVSTMIIRIENAKEQSILSEVMAFRMVNK